MPCGSVVNSRHLSVKWLFLMQEDVLEETENMIPDTIRRLGKAVEDLNDFLVCLYWLFLAPSFVDWAVKHLLVGCRHIQFLPRLLNVSLNPDRRP